MIHLYAMNDPKATHRWPFVYAHNAAEDVIEEEWNKKHPDNQQAPDLFGTDTRMEDLDLDDAGVVEVDLYGRKALAYLWGMAYIDVGMSEEIAKNYPNAEPRGNKWSARLKRGRGLVVLADDERSKAYAQKKMDERSEML